MSTPDPDHIADRDSPNHHAPVRPTWPPPRMPRGPSSLAPHIAAGLSVGCFAGAGYGLSVGVGHMQPTARKTALIWPIRAAPFAHEGAIVGTFCGVVAGGRFGVAIAVDLGYSQPISLRPAWLQRLLTGLTLRARQLAREIQS